MEKSKWVFWGSPKEAVIVLETLRANGFTPALIIAAPDRPSGRGLLPKRPPTVEWAKTEGIPYLQPEKLRVPEVQEAIQKIAPDLGIIFAYGKIIPDVLISLPRHGTLNIHPSLLPLHRGPSPVEGALLEGYTETGVTIMKVDAEMDHGPILVQEKMVIPEDALASTLLEQLVRRGAELLADIIPEYLAGKVTETIQNHTLATYTQKTKKEDGLVSLTDPAHTLWNKYRGYHPWPGIYFFQDHNGKQIRVAIKSAHLEDSTFIVDRVTPEGKKEMNYADFLRGYT